MLSKILAKPQIAAMYRRNTLASTSVRYISKNDLQLS